MRASPWGPMLCLVLLAAVTWSSADAFVFRKDAATLDAALVSKGRHCLTGGSVTCPLRADTTPRLSASPQG